MTEDILLQACRRITGMNVWANSCGVTVEIKNRPGFPKAATNCIIKTL